MSVVATEAPPAGAAGPALYDPKTTLLFGDAKDSLTKLATAVKGL